MDPQKKMRALFAEMDTCCCCCCSGYSFFCCCNSNYNCCCCCIIFNNCIPQLQCFLGCCCLKLITGLILYSNRSQYPRTSSLPPRQRQPATSTPTKSQSLETLNKSNMSVSYSSFINALCPSPPPFDESSSDESESWPSLSLSLPPLPHLKRSSAKRKKKMGAAKKPAERETTPDSIYLPTPWYPSHSISWSRIVFIIINVYRDTYILFINSNIFWTRL